MQQTCACIVFICCSLSVTLSDILEHPDDVTAVIGDPATLVCRVGTGDVRWFKDGVEMNTKDDEEVFQLPDGSLFFLSSRVGDTALYNCGNIGRDGEILMSHLAALIVNDESFEVFLDKEETTIKDGAQELTGVKITEVETKNPNRIHAEVIPEDIPPTLYIISMILVGAMTVLIIAGAAIIFRKIKNLPREHNPKRNDKEWQIPIMVTSRTVECGDQSSKNKEKFQNCDLFSDSVHHYESPLNVPEKMDINVFPPRYGYHASNDIRKGHSEKRYQQLKPVYLLSKSNQYL